MSSKHTPGPWTVERHDHIDGRLWLTILKGAWDITGNGAAAPGVIADSSYSALPEAEDLANAHLMKASPALLAACEAALLTAEMHEAATGRHLDPEYVEQLRAAIKEARGES